MNQLLLELLSLTRMYAHIPYNSIYTFVALPEYRTLDFFTHNIYDVMSSKKTFGDDWWVMEVLDGIKKELKEENVNV
jgi:hypothetical protein